jgi:hypothetical protein
MGSSLSSPVVPNEFPSKQTFRIERILASGCDYLPPNRYEDTIRVGVIGGALDDNPLSHQAIRLGGSEPYRLKAFEENTNSLKYTFEKDVSLTLMKRRDSFVYNLKTPELDVSREIYPGLVKMFKPIGVASEELDKIDKFFHS